MIEIIAGLHLAFAPCPRLHHVFRLAWTGGVPWPWQVGFCAGQGASFLHPAQDGLVVREESTHVSDFEYLPCDGWRKDDQAAASSGRLPNWYLSATCIWCPLVCVLFYFLASPNCLQAEVWTPALTAWQPTQPNTKTHKRKLTYDFDVGQISSLYLLVV